MIKTATTISINNKEELYENVPVKIETDEKTGITTYQFSISSMDVVLEYDKTHEALKFKYYHNADDYYGYIDSVDENNCYISTKHGDFYLDVRFIVFRVRDNFIDIRYTLVQTETAYTLHGIQIIFEEEVPSIETPQKEAKEEKEKNSNGQEVLSKNK